MNWPALAAVATGGALGSVLRFLVGSWFLQRLGPSFPWGTFAVNVSGAFLIGVVMHATRSRTGLGPNAQLFLATGVLGGYTTFSAFAYETYLLSRDALSLNSVWYALGSLVAGLLAAVLGIAVARALF